MVQWVTNSTGGYDNNYGIGLAVDGAGNSYALVVMDDGGTSITFGSKTVSTVAGGSPLLILVKYDTTGTAQWAQLLDSAAETYGSKVAVDAAGNVYVRGTFNSSLTVGSSFVVASTGSSKNAFIAKFNSSGGLTWVRNPQGKGGSVSEGGVAVDPAGNVYISGAFNTNLDFGNGIILTNKANASALFGDAFLAQYNSAGTAEWAQAAGGTSGGFFWDIALDAHTNVHTSGFLGYNAAVEKYNASGTLLWTESASGPPASPVASGVIKGAVDTAGDDYLAGFYAGTATFGATILQPQESWNFFLTKMPPLPFPITTNGVGSQAGMFAGYSSSNYLVGIQGDGSAHYTNITAQLISTDGTLVGSRISTGRTGGIPYVGFGGTNYVLVWSDNKLVAGGGNDQLYGQFISRSGALVGSPFTFGPTSEEEDLQGGGGSLLAFDGNNYLAVWDTGAFHNATSGNVHAALFSQTGALVGSIIPITSGTSIELTPTVAFGKTNYLVVWNDVSLGNIDGEFVSTNGTHGSPFVISQTTTPSYNPCCVAFDGTNFLAVWNKDITGTQVWNLYGRLVSPAGTFPGNEVAMVTETNSPVWPSLAYNGANYLLAWNVNRSTTNSQIQFQYFNTAAAPVSPEFNCFAPQGTNAPFFAGILSAGNQFEATAILGGATGIGASGLNFTSGTGVYGAFIPTNSTVTVALPVILSAPQITASKTNFAFLLSGPVGSNYVLQVSTNLLNWNPVSTSAIPVSGTITVTNAINGFNRRFYRAYLQ